MATPDYNGCGFTVLLKPVINEVLYMLNTMIHSYSIINIHVHHTYYQIDYLKWTTIFNKNAEHMLQHYYVTTYEAPL